MCFPAHSSRERALRLRPLSVNGVATGHAVCIAESWWQRALGLLLTPEHTSAAGLWLDPCNSVHMVGMRYAIDVVYLDKQFVVVKIVPGLKPFRLSACPRARSAVELRAGLAGALGLAVGDRLAMR